MNIKVFFLLCFFSAMSHASVNVDILENGQPVESLTLPEGARLSDLLHHDKIPANTYWRTAQLTNTKRMQSAETEKLSVINELNRLQQRWHEMQRDDLAASTQKIIQDVSATQVTGRFAIALDPDLSRAEPMHNPLLKGDYTLFIAPRKPLLHLIGLTSSDARQVLYSGVGLSDYWQAYHLLPGADPAFMYVIQPTAEVTDVPVAIWNKLHREPMAGATLFIGFDPELLPAEHKNINKRIATLMTNRVPQ